MTCTTNTPLRRRNSWSKLPWTIIFSSSKYCGFAQRYNSDSLMTKASFENIITAPAKKKTVKKVPEWLYRVFHLLESKGLVGSMNSKKTSRFDIFCKVLPCSFQRIRQSLNLVRTFLAPLESSKNIKCN